MRFVGTRFAAVAPVLALAVIGMAASPAAAQHNVLELVTTGPNAGNPSVAHIAPPRSSADGRHVFFDTRESLVTEDQDSCQDPSGEPTDPPVGCLDLYERFNRSTRLVSAGGNGPHDTRLWGIAADGSKVMFSTYESLVPQDTDGMVDVYLWSNGATRIVSQGPSGGNGPFHAEGVPRISRDGSRVVFVTSEALVPEDQNSCADVYEWSGGSVRRVSTGSDESIPPPPSRCDSYMINNTGADERTVSADGSHVFFYSDRPLVSEDDPGNGKDLYERSGGVTRLLSTGPTAGSRDIGSRVVDFKTASANGSRVFFWTNDPLVPEDTNTLIDYYEADASGIRLVAPPPVIADRSLVAEVVGVSDDGSHVFIYTRAQLSPEDTDNELDVYDRYAGSYGLVTTGPVERPGGGGGLNFQGNFQLSGDGLRVFFATDEQLVPEDMDQNQDIYQRAGGITRLVTTGPASTTALPLHLTAISADGTTAIFYTSERLVAEDTDSFSDAYEWADGVTYLVPTGIATDNGDVYTSGISDDGSRIFLSTTARLTPDDTDDLNDIYAASVNRGPRCSGAATPNVLWPANDRLRAVSIRGASDPDGDALTVTITGVTQDEPHGRRPDAVRTSKPDVVQLRAKRAQRGDGRVYRIAFTASDGRESCTGTAKVSVPRHRHRAAVDSAPPSYNSFAR
jgi:hypothetical protein